MNMDPKMVGIVYARAIEAVGAILKSKGLSTGKFADEEDIVQEVVVGYVEWWKSNLFPDNVSMSVIVGIARHKVVDSFRSFERSRRAQMKLVDRILREDGDFFPSLDQLQTESDMWLEKTILHNLSFELSGKAKAVFELWQCGLRPGEVRDALGAMPRSSYHEVSKSIRRSYEMVRNRVESHYLCKYLAACFSRHPDMENAERLIEKVPSGWVPNWCILAAGGLPKLTPEPASDLRAFIQFQKRKHCSLQEGLLRKGLKYVNNQRIEGATRLALAVSLVFKSVHETDNLVGPDTIKCVYSAVQEFVHGFQLFFSGSPSDFDRIAMFIPAITFPQVGVFLRGVIFELKPFFSSRNCECGQTLLEDLALRLDQL